VLFESGSGLGSGTGSGPGLFFKHAFFKPT
jgi:hypothetical protein